MALIYDFIQSWTIDLNEINNVYNNYLKEIKLQMHNIIRNGGQTAEYKGEALEVLLNIHNSINRVLRDVYIYFNNAIITNNIGYLEMFKIVCRDGYIVNLHETALHIKCEIIRFHPEGFYSNSYLNTPWQYYVV